jgi:hypothetical protein
LRRPVRRPSISACRRRQARATYPQTRTGRPRTPAQPPPEGGASWSCSGWGLPSHPGHPGCWWSLTPPFHPYPALAHGAVCSLWHCPAGHPGLPLTTTLPCGVRTFLGTGPRRGNPVTRPPGQLVRAGHPTPRESGPSCASGSESGGAPQRQHTAVSGVGMAWHCGQSRSSQHTGSPPSGSSATAPSCAHRDGHDQRCATSTTIRTPSSTDTRNGSRARTPIPMVV